MTYQRQTPIRARAWRLGAVTAFAVAALGACGGGDDDAPEAAAPAPAPAPASGVDIDAYCEDSVAIEALGSQSPETPDDLDAARAFGEEMMALLTDLQSAAPEAAQAPLGQLAPLVRAVAESGDTSAFQAPEFTTARAGHHQVGLAECGWGSSTVTMQDYSFTGLPDSLDAGVHSFELTNEGNEPHVMILLRKNDGVTESFDELLALPEEEANAKATVAGQGFTDPGGSGYVLADLAPGEYLAMCPLPTGWVDMSAPPPDGPPHFTHGMTHQLVVE
jgi:hypothetical protein